MFVNLKTSVDEVIPLNLRRAVFFMVCFVISKMDGKRKNGDLNEIVGLHGGQSLKTLAC